MKFEIETGTDVAAIAVAADGGTVWRGETGADGAFLVHLFVNEEPPEDVARFLRDRQVIAPFPVSSGRVVVAGDEFVKDPARLAKYPHMGAEVQIPAGTYELSAYRVDEERDEAIEQRFAAAATTEELRAEKRDSVIGGVAVGGTVVGIVIAVFLWSLIPIVVSAAVWGWWVWSRKSAAYVSAQRKYHEVERELPSIVIVLRN
jgi:hypothetical protein